MKVLHVNSSDTHGGAARAAYRLHHGLRNIAIDSRMLVQEKAATDNAVIGPRGLVQKSLARIRPYAEVYAFRYLGGGAKTFFSPSWFGMSGASREIASQNPDIVHIHWICAGMLRAVDLPAIRQPIVWTMHDMWPFTGGCHSADACLRYQKQCGNCPQLERSGPHDASRRLLQKKREAWRSLNLTIVAPSRWMAKCAAESSLFSGKHIEVVPNGLDAELFKPMDKTLQRLSLRLPVDKRLVLFGAINATSDKRKGFQFLPDAIEMLDPDVKKNIEIIVFGRSNLETRPDFGVPVHFLGKINNDVVLASIYSAADVMIVPSAQEAFGNTAIEAMACGTPVVAFNAGGLVDIVSHRENGYLATVGDSLDLANGIEWVLEDEDRYSELAELARQKVLIRFTEKVVAEQYYSLYESLLS